MDIGAGLKDRAVNKPLDAERPSFFSDRIAIQREFKDVVRLYKGWAQCARQKISVRIAGMAYADVSIFVKDTLSDQNAIRDGQLIFGAL